MNHLLLFKKHEESERKRFTQFMKESLDYLLAAKYERVSIEAFQEMMVELFDDDIPKMKEIADVEKLFANRGESEHVVWYSRVLCAAYMKLNADRFLPFLGEEWPSVEEYCSREVEPQGKECEQLQIIALAEVLQVRVQIEYLSPTSTENSEPVCLGPEDARLMIKFLYRPGHYDILYD